MRAEGKLAPGAVDKVEGQVLMDGREITGVIRSAGVVSEILGGEDNVLVLDGMPRSMDQLLEFEETVSEAGGVLYCVVSTRNLERLTWVYSAFLVRTP